MFERLLTPSTQRSFFLFGARGTGKTTFLRKQFFLKQKPRLEINLLNPQEYETFLTNPSELYQRISAIPSKIKNPWILIDEIQKIPALLDVAHDLIEERKLRFALTGSSARKLKRGGANLLAGRASVYHLFPLTSLELAGEFDLQQTLEWGSLPGIFELGSRDKIEYLQAYTQQYLKEEILEEQLLRKITPFKKFLDLAAASSGQIINYSNFARNCGSDPVSIKSYFEILSDTLIGFRIDAYDRSIRKRQMKNPKFYLFDLGVKRALEGSLGQRLNPSTGSYGMHFEHFIIQEIIRRASYLRKQWRYSYLRTKDDAEIDLIIEEHGQAPRLIEIKSSTRLEERQLAVFSKLCAAFPEAKSFCFSNDPHSKKILGIRTFHWKKGLEALGL